MKTKTLIIFIILILIVLAIAIIICYNINKSAPPIIVGNDTDSHGCIGSAGYSWCPEKQKCLRVWEENCTTACDYNNPDKVYLKNDSDCIINFLCIKDKKAFHDSCGCGCESIDINSSDEKTYCTPKQKKAEVCPEYYSATCGWFNQTIRCLRYPCAQTFDNPCFACASPNVEFYTPGECPK